MKPETENQLVHAQANAATQIEMALSSHEVLAANYLAAKLKLEESAKRLHDLRDAHYELEFLLEHKRMPTLADAFGLSAIPPEIQQRITDALLAPAVMQAAADAAESVRAAHPFESQTPQVFAETSDGLVFEVGKGEELKEGADARLVDRVDELNELSKQRTEQRTEAMWAELDSLIARLCETEPRAKILAATRRAYEAAKAEM